MAALKKKEVELLPREDWEKSSTGKILKWVLEVGRYIVIATELVVVLAFLSRFKLDRDLTNLYESIKEKQVFIEANRNLEENFRHLQAQLTIIEKGEEERLALAEIPEKLTELMPIEITLNTFSLNETEVKLTATALSEDSLNSFLKNLEKSSWFSPPQLNYLTTGLNEGLGIKFELTTQCLIKKV